MRHTIFAVLDFCGALATVAQVRKLLKCSLCQGGHGMTLILVLPCDGLVCQVAAPCGAGDMTLAAVNCERCCWRAGLLEMHVSTPLMLAVLNLFTVLGWDRIGMPGPQTVLAAGLFFMVLCFWQPTIKVWPQPSALRRLRTPEHWSVRFALFGYFATLVFIGSNFSPEKQVSTGVHQEFGPCDATDIDLLGLQRKRYICRDRFPHEYFRLECEGNSLNDIARWTRLTPEQSMKGGVASWYTICGQDHPHFQSWMAGLVALCVAGAFLFYWAMTLREESEEHKEAAIPQTTQTSFPQGAKASTDEDLRRRQPRTATPSSRGRV
ncbi:unnamed protein product [Symbiodinium pilosum]|uniref:DUF7802 domain-containing protein n=1 Tax=Symbiodinium pilosum TaxID=2952 RepID=A0A812YHK9_SYMPI|nr:unnamed protein product [Symbiodinium pilosum]